MIGTIHQTDAAAAGAQSAATTANNALSAQPCDFGPFGPTDLAGQTLVPGVYCYSSSVQNSGTFTLSGTATDVWVFRIGSTLTTGSGSSMVASGAQNCNVFWQVGSSATLGTGSNVLGSIIATASITLNSAASLSGRALALNGAVTLDNNNVSVSVCAPAPLPAKLGLAKTVVNTGGGSATAAQFTLTATGPAVITGPAPVTAVNAPVGVYTLNESNLANYTAGVFSCSGGGTLVGNQLTIAAADAGNTITCSITNTYTPNPTRLGLLKNVVNTGGGTATTGQFTLTASGPTFISGPAPVAAINAATGVYTLTESNLANYTAGIFSCSGGGTLVGNQLTISAADAGNTITCSITNTFRPAIVSTIPTLSEWAMILLACILAIAGFISMNRQEGAF